MLPPPPERVGPYRLEDRLGIGGMGAVYGAYDERLERPVAIKHILPELAGDSKAWKRLRREAKAVARMNHPAVVQIYDIVEHDDGDWIVMELIDGRTLSSMLEDGPFELDQALGLIRQVVAGLAAAHAKGVVHRDLKTENVMVTRDGQVKILDFGLAKSLWRGPDSSLSVEGSILGTGRAMSPEQAFGDEISQRSDLFSLGTLIYEVTTGEAPFKGASIFRVLAQICSDPHPPPREVNPALPEELAELIDHLLQKDPVHRPASAEQVLESLEAIVLLPSQGNETPAKGGAGETPPRRGANETQTARQPAAPWKTRPARTGVTGEHAVDDTLWMNPVRLPGRRPKESTSSIQIQTLLRIMIKKPRGRRLPGDGSSQVIGSRHDRLVRGLLARFGGLEIDKLDDGFLLLFKLPSEAVLYALDYQQRLVEECVDLAASIGIHLDELHMTENLPADVSRGAKQLEVAGPAKLMVSRAATLAGVGQVLMTQMAYELARRAITGEEDIELDWVAHGKYRIQGAKEDQLIFEVGFPGEISNRPPDDTPAASRLPGQRDHKVRLAGGRRKRWILPLLAAVAVLAFGLWWRWSSEADTRRPTLAVMGFKNLSGRAEMEWMSTALAELFAAELAAGGDLRLVTGESVARMKLELAVPTSEALAADTLHSIRRNLGTDLVLVGSYLALDDEGKTLRLQPRLQPTDDGETILVTATGSESELFELVSRAALGLRKGLGLGGISSQEKAAVQATLSANQEANRLYFEGLEKLRGFDVPAARDSLRQAVEAEPSFALAHAALSEAWRALGFDREALASAKSAYEQAEGLPREQVLSIQGRFYEADSRWQEAIDTFRTLSDIAPDNVDYGLRLAEVQTSAGRGRHALITIEELRKLPEPAREDPRIDLARANAAYSLSDYQAMVAATTKAENKGRALKAKVLVAEALYTKGRALRRLGSNPAAAEALQEAWTIFAEVGDRGKVAQALTSIAVLSKFKGDLTGAEQLYRQALSIHRQTGNRKETSRLLNNLAIVIQERGDLATASSMLEEAVTIAREDGRPSGVAGYQEALAQVRLAQGDLRAARTLAEEALAIFGEISSRGPQAWVHYALGRIVFAAGEVTSAGRELDAALAICDEIGNKSLSGRVRSAQGEVLLSAGDLDAAATALDYALAIRSELGEKGMIAQTQLIRGQLLIETERFSEAEALMREVTGELSKEARSDDEITATTVLARALLAQGRLAEAGEVEARARLRAKDSQNPAIRLSVAITDARLLAAAGELAPALRELEAALAEATDLGMLGLAFEARLALGEIEIASGAAGDAVGEARLQALAEEAGSAGFGLIARAAANPDGVASNSPG